MQIAAELNAERVGTETEAVIEDYDSEAGLWLARTAADAPDIDGYLFITGVKRELMTGDFIKVKITGSNEYDLIGEEIQ